MTTTTTVERPAVPTAEQLRESAARKLTVREYGALRAQLKRELTAELTGKSNRAPRVRELPEVAGAARRMVRALGERAAHDVEGLAELAQLRDVVDAALQAAVDGARSLERHAVPYSWADVARVLGTSRQAAQQRFGR